MTERLGPPTQRVRPLLLVLLWIWAGCIALVLDLFLNVSGFDSVRPRAPLYRAMRMVGHELVGEEIDTVEMPSAVWRGALLHTVSTPEGVRLMRRFCDTAVRDDIPDLKRVALTSSDPLAVGNAIRALGRLRAVLYDERLVSLAADPRPRVRHETIMAVGASGDPSAVKVLKPLLKHDDTTTRLLAIQAMGRIGGESAQVELGRLKGDSGLTEDERVFVRAALGR